MSPAWFEFLASAIPRRAALWLEPGVARLHIASTRIGRPRWTATTWAKWLPPPSAWGSESERLIGEAVAGIVTASGGRLWTSFDVILGSLWAPALSVDLGLQPLPRGVIGALARRRWAEVWGPTTALWPIQNHSGERTGRMLTYACDTRVVEAVLHGLRRSGMRRPRAVRPSLFEALRATRSHSSRRTQAGALEDAWLLVAEHDRTLALRLEQGKPTVHVVIQSLEAGQEDRMLQLLTEWESRLEMRPARRALHYSPGLCKPGIRDVDGWSWVDVPAFPGAEPQDIHAPASTPASIGTEAACET